MAEQKWLPLSITDWPKNTYVYLRGASGYMGTKYRVMVAKYDEQYRPRQPWVTVSGDSVMEDGAAAQLKADHDLVEHEADVLSQGASK